MCHAGLWYLGLCVLLRYGSVGTLRNDGDRREMAVLRAVVVAGCRRKRTRNGHRRQSVALFRIVRRRRRQVLTHVIKRVKNPKIICTTASNGRTCILEMPFVVEDEIFFPYH